MNLKPCEIQRWEGFSQGALQHSWEQRTDQHPKWLTCRILSHSYPQGNLNKILSAPFLHHLGCHSPAAQSPLPQIQFINPLPTHPVMLGCCPAAKPSCCQALCALREDFGTCGLLEVLSVLSSSCTPRQQCCCKARAVTHTQPYRSGFEPGTRAAGVSPALSSGLQHTLSCWKEGRGHLGHAADRGSDASSQSCVFDLPHHGWNKQLFQYIEIHYGPFSNKMKCKLLATVINWSTVLTDYN